MGVLLTPSELQWRRLERYAPPCDCTGFRYYELVAYVQSTGNYAFRLECTRCRQLHVGDIKHARLSRYEMAEAEVCRMSPAKQYEPCARCGRSDYTEEHHWAPQETKKGTCAICLRHGD